MKSLNISLPDALREYVESQAGDRTGYSTPSEYIRDLIRKDRQRKTVDRINDLVREGLESGPPKPLPANWKDRMRKAGRRLARQMQTKPNATRKNGRSAA